MTTAPTPPEAPPEGEGPPPVADPSGWQRWMIVGALMLGVALLMGDTLGAAGGPQVDYSAFYAAVAEGQVDTVELRGERLSGTFGAERAIDGRTLKRFRTTVPPHGDPTLLPLLRKHDTAIKVLPADGSAIGQLTTWLLPWGLIIGLWWWIARRARQGSGGNPLAGVFGNQSKRFARQDDVDATFDDVAGHDAAKRDLGEVLDFLRAPERFERMGGKMPRGVLLVGPPGTGKTLLARAVAGEAGVPFFSITGSEFIEMFVGVGASRVRELFEAARKASPAIVFIDEIDAVGRSRGTGFGGGHDEREQTLNQLLAAMDGFDRTDRIVVMAATNRPDVLDPALLRPGRFDRRVLVDLPAAGARVAILKVHCRDRPLSRDVRLEAIAQATPGFSGADLANLVNEATLHAIRRGAELIAAEDFAAAHDKIQLGDPRETHLSPAEKRRVAVHEAGHALVAFDDDELATLRRVSIIPRGMALGVTQQSPRGDQHLHTKSQLQGRLRVLMGGYAAEKLLLGESSSGAQDDLRQASDLAHKMVAQMGMSDALGPVFHEHRSDHPFLGARIGSQSAVSDATVHAIEREASALSQRALDDATATLTEERPRLERLVAALLEHETLDSDALSSLLDRDAPASGPRIDRAAS